MKPIKAAVCRAFGSPLSVEDVLLAPPGPDQVEVTMEACAICHSDISYAEGAWGGTLPAVYGHEGVGRITALGPNVTGVGIGDRVLVTLIWACGACPPCHGGTPVHCEVKWTRDDPGPLRQADGGPLVQGLSCGAFAEAAVVHKSQVIAIPDTVAPEAAALLSCGVITGLGAAVNTAGVRPGETVVVIGAGGVGLNTIQGARIAGAGRIVAVDMTEEKLATAKAFGATDGILATQAAPWETLATIDPRLAHAVFVTVGAIPAYEHAVKYLRPRGKLVMVGMPHLGAQASYEPVLVAAAGQALVGSLMGDTVLARDIPWIVDLYHQGRLQLDGLVSGRWPLEQINTAIENTRSGAARRNVIVF